MTHPVPSAAVAGLADEVRDARSRGHALRVVGAGTWLDAGRPSGDGARLNVGALAGVVTYEPGDLTLTVKAGTSLAHIRALTAAEGQWLPLEPMGAAAGTIGATVATASYGPLASSFGTPRDQVLGCEFVSGTGDVVRAGGRVVKNVAGFDLVRLMTGAWGTLGALTEITVRLRARPEADQTFAVHLGATAHQDVADAAWRWTRDSEYTAFCAELVSANLARALNVGTGATLLARLGGNEAYARAAGDDIAALGEAHPADTDVWSRLAASEPSGATVVRVSTLPSRIGAVWDRACDVTERYGGYAHATVSRGVVRCVLPSDHDDDDALRLAVAHLVARDTVIVERAPAAVWRTLSTVRATEALDAGVRRAFDPDGIMNPGMQGDIA